MKIKLIIWFVSLLLIIVIIIKSKRDVETFTNTNTKKQFNTKLLDKTFGIEGCDVLVSTPSGQSVLPVLVRENARSYLDTGRIKKWKPSPAMATRQHEHDPHEPQQSAQNTSNVSYCFVNNDIENRAQDYFMSGHTCNKSDTNFNNVPFISDVFIDPGRQTTSTQTGQQCVFKIDHDQVTEESLVNFWSNNVAKSECLNKYNYIIELNQSLSNQYAAVQRKVHQVEGEISQQERVMSANVDKIATSNVTLSDLMTTYNGLKVTLSNWTGSNSILEQEIEEFNRICSSDTTVLNQRLDTCNTACNVVLQLYDPLSSKQIRLKSDMSTFQVRYDGLVNDININTNMLSTLQSLYNEEFTAYNNAETAYNLCLAEDATCEANLGDCKTMLKTDRIYEQLQHDNNDQCASDYTQCTGNLQICTATSNALVQSITTYRGLTAKCVNDKATCITTDTRVLANIGTLQDRYIYVKEYYNYENCRAFQEEIKKLTDTETDLLERCQRAQITSDNAKTDTINVINKTGSDLATALTTCQSSVETVRTTMNNPPVIIDTDKPIL